MGLDSAARAQQALYVADGKSTSEGQSAALVADADGHTPLIEKDGKLVEAATRQYALLKVPEYQPVFVAVRHLSVKDAFLQPLEGGEGINHTFEFYAVFESLYRLDHVFMVLELIPEKGPKVIFLQQIGSLVPHEPSPLQLGIPLAEEGMGQAHFIFHLFVGGREVLQSLIPEAARERILDHMVAKRVVSAPDGPPVPFVGPPPEYPKALLAAKTTGDAVVLMRISPRGSVLDPRIKSASDPAFGASAIEALSVWRFLPKIANGRPVEAMATIPVHFAP